MLDTPIIVSDEEIKEGWKGWAYKVDVTGKIFKHFYTTNPWYKDARKIIAGIKGLPSIDWNGLEEEFGWVNVEKIAKNYNPPFLQELSIVTQGKIEGFIKGFKKAQSINEKKFSLEDMFKCFQAGIDYEKEGSILQPDAHGYIQSLQQPKVFDIIVEMEQEFTTGITESGRERKFYGEFKPKITNNSIKILKKLWRHKLMQK